MIEDDVRASRLSAFVLVKRHVVGQERFGIDQGLHAVLNGKDERDSAL
jgi:hypothetical protein